MVVVMVVDEDMSGSGGGLIRAEMISDYTGGPRLPPRTGAYSGWTLSPFEPYSRTFTTSLRVTTALEN